MDIKNPCLGCGACCAFFRVAFYWREAEPADSLSPVPKNYFVELTAQQRAMKGTEVKHRPQCVGLKGKIGKDAGCSIYSQRPSPCRAFKASYEDGTQQVRCDEARMAHGLRPLTKQDWAYTTEKRRTEEDEKKLSFEILV